MPQERIDVYYKPLVAGAFHKYIVYTDSKGSQFAARGGPEGGFSGIIDNLNSDSNSGSEMASVDASNNPDVIGHGAS